MAEDFVIRQDRRTLPFVQGFVEGCHFTNPKLNVRDINQYIICIGYKKGFNNQLFCQSQNRYVHKPVGLDFSLSGQCKSDSKAECLSSHRYEVPSCMWPQMSSFTPGTTHILSSGPLQRQLLTQLNQVAQEQLDTHKPKLLPHMSPLIPLSYSISMFHRKWWEGRKVMGYIYADSLKPEGAHDLPQKYSA